MAVVDYAGRAQEGGSVGTHGGDEEDALESGAGAGFAVGEPGAAVIVPEGARVYETLLTDQPNGFFPSAQGVLGAHHEDTAVRVANEDVVPAVVVADGGGPYGFAVLDGHVGAFVVLKRGTHQLPVDEVAGVEYGKAGHAVEGRCRHPVVVPYPADVGVRIVEVEYGVCVSELGGLVFRS